MNCIFCNILKNNTAIIYEDEFFFSIFDKFPVTPGNALIIAKRHVTSSFDLTQKEWVTLKKSIEETTKVINSTDLNKLYTNFINSPLNEVSQKYSKKMLEHLAINKKPEGYNLCINEGEAAGRTVHHFHFNILPRFMGDMNGPQRGIKKIFPEFECYLDKK